MTTTTTTTPAKQGNAKSTPAKQAPKAKGRKVALPANTFSLANLARDMNVNPKIARAKARRHAKELAQYRHGTDGWLFKDSAKDHVTKFLKTAK